MRIYEESHSGWMPRSDVYGGYDIVDQNGWALATIPYDYRYTCNATNHFRANLLASAPELFEYVKSSASAGCATAKSLIDKINDRNI